MKKNLLKCVGTGLLGLVLTVIASDQQVVAQAAAQVDQRTPVITQTEDDGFDYGWLGLLGLLGLTGLLRGDRHHQVHRDTTPSAGTNTTRS